MIIKEMSVIKISVLVINLNLISPILPISDGLLYWKRCGFTIVLRDCLSYLPMFEG